MLPNFYKPHLGVFTARYTVIGALYARYRQKVSYCKRWDADVFHA
jgi:hypothetical protein